MKTTGEIYLVGLGPGDPLDLPPVNLALMRSYRTILRTGQHPVAASLQAEGINFETLDHCYQEQPSFEAVYREMADYLLQEAKSSREPIVLAVPGHPLVGESAARTLLERGPAVGVKVSVWPAPSFIDTICWILGIDPAQGLIILDSFQLAAMAGRKWEVPPGSGLLVAQLYDRAIASEVKLTLMESFPDDHPVQIITAAGIRGKESICRIPLYQLDRHEFDHLTSAYLFPLAATGKQPGVTEAVDEAEGVAGPVTGGAPGPDREGAEVIQVTEADYPLDPLVEVMDRLLAPGGCPWDRQQTHQSLKKYLVEECYEVIDAIEDAEMNKLCEELGDLLLQVVFHAALASRRGDFSLNDVVEGITTKLIRRHPHVFGNRQVKDAGEVLINWEKIKQREGEGEAAWKPLLDGVPRHMPALQRAQKVQGKASLVGFDWPGPEGAVKKLQEEWQEIRQAQAAGDQRELVEEMGDFLFAAVNVARLLEVNADEALQQAVDKFIRRFTAIEEAARAQGNDLRDLDLVQMDHLWEKIKLKESNS